MGKRRSVFTLSADAAIRYTPGERIYFDLLPQDGSRIDTLELARKRFRKNPPFHGRKIVIGAMQNLVSKVARNREAFRVARTLRAGPRAMSFWLIPRPARKAAGSSSRGKGYSSGRPGKKPASSLLTGHGRVP